MKEIGIKIPRIYVELYALHNIPRAYCMGSPVLVCATQTLFVFVSLTPNTYFRCKKGKDDIGRFSNVLSLCLMKDI